MIALDTTPAAKIAPSSPGHQQAVTRHAAGDPFAITSTVLTELLTGMEQKRGNAGWDQQRQFLARLIDEGVLTVLPFDARAATVAARLRAIRRVPPANTSTQTAQRSKAESRVAWVMDLHTAAAVFVAGSTLASDDAHHKTIASDLASFTGGVAHHVIAAPF